VPISLTHCTTSSSPPPIHTTHTRYLTHLTIQATDSHLPSHHLQTPSLPGYGSVPVEHHTTFLPLPNCNHSSTSRLTHLSLLLSALWIDFEEKAGENSIRCTAHTHSTTFYALRLYASLYHYCRLLTIAYAGLHATIPALGMHAHLPIPLSSDATCRNTAHFSARTHHTAHDRRTAPPLRCAADYTRH